MPFFLSKFSNFYAGYVIEKNVIFMLFIEFLTYYYFLPFFPQQEANQSNFERLQSWRGRTLHL